MSEFICPCGSIFLPKGSKYDPNGLSINIDGNRINLVHNTESLLSNGKVFVTTSETINLNQYIAEIVLEFHQNISIENNINIVVKSYNTKNIITTKSVGVFGETITPINQSLILLEDCDTHTNLYNDKLQIEIYSICNNFDSTCCDSSNSSVDLINKVTVLNINCCSTSTTTTPTPLGACCEKGVISSLDPISNIKTFDTYANCLGIMSESECNPQVGFDSYRVWTENGNCIDDCNITDVNSDLADLYNFPDSFISTLLGRGIFNTQEAEITFYKQPTLSCSVNKKHFYVGTGQFSCGNNITISFYFDINTGKFVYDGTIDCCLESTKIVANPSSYPLIIPNTIIQDLIIYYSECTGCNHNCTTTQPPCDSNPLIPQSDTGYNDGCCTISYDENGETIPLNYSELTPDELASIAYDPIENTCVPRIVPKNGDGSTDTDGPFGGAGSEENKLCAEKVNNSSMPDYFLVLFPGILHLTYDNLLTTTVGPDPYDNIENVCMWLEITTTTTTTTTGGPIGACCLGESCVETTEAECLENDGTYLGDDTPCLLYSQDYCTTTTTTLTPGYYLVEILSTTTTTTPEPTSTTTTSTTTTKPPIIIPIGGEECSNNITAEVKPNDIVIIGGGDCTTTTTTTTTTIPEPTTTSTTTTEPPEIICISYQE